MPLAGKLHGPPRYSRIDALKGYPLVGLANFSRYSFTEPTTSRLWRLSLGLGLG